MAVKDVKLYYLTMQAQYLEMKDDLADFEEAFKEGQITEDKLDEVKADIEHIRENFERLRYVIYLLEAPNKQSKQKWYTSNNKAVMQYFKDNGFDESGVSLENKSLLDDLRKQLNKLTKKDA